MPKVIPSGLTQKHIKLALRDLDDGIEHKFGAPTGYELIDDGKRYAPKAVIGIAFQHLRGSILPHYEFSGGNQRGQANFVLRDLGFLVPPIRPEERTFVTSRGFSLPTDCDAMSDMLWFNMWRRRLWPYNEISDGDLLYWYDSKVKAIVWQSTVNDVEQFEYENKTQVRDRFRMRFDEDPSDDQYYVDASGHGYCIGFKVTSVQQVNLPKPPNFNFPQGGWLRASNEAARSWLTRLRLPDRDGLDATLMEESAAKAEEEGYFDPDNQEDERERKLTEIVYRRGQPRFRETLVAAYRGHCAITGCDATQALEAAHIAPYHGPQSNHVSNGLLLRADIHTLFDLNILAINPITLAVVLAESLRETAYKEIEGRSISVPRDPQSHPSSEALKQRWEDFSGKKDLN